MLAIFYTTIRFFYACLHLNRYNKHSLVDSMVMVSNGLNSKEKPISNASNQETSGHLKGVHALPASDYALISPCKC